MERMHVVIEFDFLDGSSPSVVKFDKVTGVIEAAYENVMDAARDSGRTWQYVFDMCRARKWPRSDMTVFRFADQYLPCEYVDERRAVGIIEPSPGGGWRFRFSPNKTMAGAELGVTDTVIARHIANMTPVGDAYVFEVDRLGYIKRISGHGDPRQPDVDSMAGNRAYAFSA